MGKSNERWVSVIAHTHNLTLLLFIFLYVLSAILYGDGNTPHQSKRRDYKNCCVFNRDIYIFQARIGKVHVRA